MKALVYSIGLVMVSIAVGYDTQSIPRAFECLGGGLILLAIVSKDSSVRT